MQTETIAAWQVEEGDTITLGGEAIFVVAETHDETTSLSLVLTDEDGETDHENPVSFMAWEDITLVTSLDDEEEDEEEE